jgi:hypothetical protein
MNYLFGEKASRSLPESLPGAVEKKGASREGEKPPGKPPGKNSYPGGRAKHRGIKREKPPEKPPGKNSYPGGRVKWVDSPGHPGPLGPGAGNLPYPQKINTKIFFK